MRRLLVATGFVVAIAGAVGVWLSARASFPHEGSGGRAVPSQFVTITEPPPTEQRAVAVLGSAGSRSPSATTETLDEGSLMERLRTLKERDAALVIALARDGNRRFPDSPAASERASILIHALASQGRSSEARGEAEDAVNRYPDSLWVREIEQFTGAHRHRNIRLNDAGLLEYH